MPYENARSELIRLLTEQNKIRQAEVFGGLSTVELAEYNRNSTRINELEIGLSTGADQRHYWNRDHQPDLSQNEAQQPYRSREDDSSNSLADSGRTQADEKSDGEKQSHRPGS